MYLGFTGVNLSVQRLGIDNYPRPVGFLVPVISAHIGTCVVGIEPEVGVAGVNGGGFCFVCVAKVRPGEVKITVVRIGEQRGGVDVALAVQAAFDVAVYH